MPRRPMRRALILLRRRLIGAVPVLLLVVIGTFFLLEAAGGDAVDAYIVSTGGDAGLIEALRQRWGLDQSAVTRLANYLWALAHLDLGWSVTFSRPILDVIRERLPNTLLLMGSATALSFSLGSALGIVAGARPGSLRDRLLSVGSLALYADSRLLARAGADRGLRRAAALAAAGRHRDRSPRARQGLPAPLDIARHLVLPVAALGFIYLALYLRIMRAGMAEVWRMDFVLAAKARGISRTAHRARPCRAQRAAAARHHARPAIGGDARRQRRHRDACFPIPGLGRLAQEAVASRDTPLLLGIILVSAVLVIFDQPRRRRRSMPLLDPRIGSGEPA